MGVMYLTNATPNVEIAARGRLELPAAAIQAGADVSLDFEFPGDSRDEMVRAIFMAVARAMPQVLSAVQQSCSRLDE